MRTRDKQNKHKLKFEYIAQLKKLGGIWKEHSNLLDTDIEKTDRMYIYEVVKLMDIRKRDEFCSTLDRCDDIFNNLSKVDKSLKYSHDNFLNYKKIILEISE